MDGFVANGWAMEVKVDSVEETVDVEAEVEPKRARNEKGQLVGDDPDYYIKGKRRLIMEASISFIGFFYGGGLSSFYNRTRGYI